MAATWANGTFTWSKAVAQADLTTIGTYFLHYQGVDTTGMTNAQLLVALDTALTQYVKNTAATQKGREDGAATANTSSATVSAIPFA